MFKEKKYFERLYPGLVLNSILAPSHPEQNVHIHYLCPYEQLKNIIMNYKHKLNNTLQDHGDEAKSFVAQYITNI